MYKTNYFLTVFVVGLCWKSALSNPENVFRTISNARIFFDEVIVSISSLQEDGKIKETADVDELMNDHPHLVYTAMKCKYSDAIVELLQTFFEINEYGMSIHAQIEEVPSLQASITKWLTASINQFTGIKPLVAKIIDGLFSRADRHAVLKTDDRSLLKTLLSINLFLSYTINDGPLSVYVEQKGVKKSKRTKKNFYAFVENVRMLNMSIIQMIGLVERFRTKRCFVQNPTEYSDVAKDKLILIQIDDEENIKNLTEPALEILHLLAKHGPSDFAIFTSYVYDLEHMLFGNVLKHNNSFLGQVQIRWNGEESDLMSVHNKIKSTYSIKQVLEYQHSLINAMADIFYGQIYQTLRKENVSTVDFKCLQINFKMFVENVMPNGSENERKEALNSEVVCLKDALEKYSNLELLTLLEDRFKPDNDKISIYKNVKDQFHNDPYLTSFAYLIRSDEQRVTFVRVFELLSNEAHRNCDYTIFMN